MRTRTAIGLAAVFIAGMTLVPMSAKAVCQVTIYAERSVSDGTNAQVLGRVSSADAFSYFASTAVAQLANLIFSAVAQRNSLVVVGNVGACPTTGALRDLGTILTLVQQP
jgi:hypothetical protein